MHTEWTDSLLPAPAWAVPAVLTFTAAAHAVQLERLAWAAALLGTLDDGELRGHFDAVGDEWRRRNLAAAGSWSDGASSERDASRMPPGLGELSVFRRDGWHCRWCSAPVIARSATKAMTRRLGAVFPDGGTNATQHGLILVCSASLDHVIAHSKGGTNSADNLVTACWPCQFGRGNDTRERIGLNDPSTRPIPVTLAGWDGCAWFT